MNCARVEREEIVEAYLSGTIDGSVREEFEEHYFGCDTCFGTLRAARAVREALSDMPVVPVRRAGRQVLWPAVGIAAAAALCAVLWLNRPADSPQQPIPAGKAALAQGSPTGEAQLLALAAFDAPSYNGGTMRGTGDQAESVFSAAMKSYRAGHYDEALPGLRRAADQKPDEVRYRYFLGVTQLLAGQTEAGVAQLETAVAQGESPFLDEAYFHLAKGQLKLGRVAEARAALGQAARLNRDYAAPARTLLGQLERFH